MLLTIEKSPGALALADLAFWFACVVAVGQADAGDGGRGASPVFLIVTAFELWTPAAVRRREALRQAEDGRDDARADGPSGCGGSSPCR